MVPRSRFGAIRRLETIQRFFTYRIESMKDLNYLDRLKRLNFYSLELRHERYAIIYTWKIINGIVLNIFEDVDQIRTYDHIRRESCVLCLG